MRQLQRLPTTPIVDTTRFSLGCPTYQCSVHTCLVCYFRIQNDTKTPLRKFFFLPGRKMDGRPMFKLVHRTSHTFLLDSKFAQRTRGSIIRFCCTVRLENAFWTAHFVGYSACTRTKIRCTYVWRCARTRLTLRRFASRSFQRVL